MEAMVHDKPHKRQTFAEHCSKAYVLGTSTEHYRCWKFWTISTQSTRISGTAFFKHKYLTNPGITPEDRIIAAATRLTNAIQGTTTTNIHTSTLQSLDNLQQIFHDAARKADSPSNTGTRPRQETFHPSQNRSHRCLTHPTLQHYPRAHLQGCYLVATDRYQAHRHGTYRAHHHETHHKVQYRLIEPFFQNPPPQPG